MSLSANCFRLRAVLYDRESRDLLQIESTGTLYEVLAYLLQHVRGEPQVVVIVKEEDEKCIENAVLEELSIASGDPSIDLNEEGKKLEEKYRKVYERNYTPPKVKIKYPCVTFCENDEVA